MKRIMAVLVCVFLLTGCASQVELDEAKQKELQNQIASLEQEKASLEQYISDYKKDNDIKKYVVTLEIKQSHFTLDIGEHAKDSMNKIKLEIPVDKQYFDSINEGDTLDDSFRFGSWLMNGSYGSWKVKILKKEIR
jgi:uncharacterized protein YceK